MSVILQVDGAGGLALSFPPVPGIWDLHILMYYDAVLINGDTCVLFYTAVGVESRSPEFDIIGLPRLRRQACIDFGPRHVIQTRAIAGSMDQAE